MPWHPPYDFLAARSSFVDAWPAAWHALVPESVMIGLDGFAVAGRRLI